MEGAAAESDCVETLAGMEGGIEAAEEGGGWRKGFLGDFW